MTPYELFQEAKLTDAVEAALALVKSAPTDVSARLLLCDLLCLANQLERADGQLEIVAQQASELTLGVSLYRQLIRAEVARQDVMESGRAPEFTGDVPDVLKLHVRALIALREGAVVEATELLLQADDLRPRMYGSCDTNAFDDFRDLDDLTAPFLEVLTSTGKYFWVDWTRVESLEFQPPKQLRDLLWRPTEMVTRDGASAVVYVPVLYVGSDRSADEALRIGRTTDWVETPSGPMRGCGQRMFFVAEESRPILSIQNITFSRDRTASSSASRQ